MGNLRSDKPHATVMHGGLAHVFVDMGQCGATGEVLSIGGGMLSVW